MDWGVAANVAAIVFGLAGISLGVLNRKDYLRRFKAERRDQLGARIDLQGRSGGSDSSRGPHLTCAIANIGASTAFDVTPVAIVGDRRIPAMSRIPPMPAGSDWPQQRCYFQLGASALGPGDADDLPAYVLEVTYRDGFGEHRVEFSYNPEGI